MLLAGFLFPLLSTALFLWLFALSRCVAAFETIKHVQKAADAHGLLSLRDQALGEPR
ncbi:hypothetical protein D3C78_1981580 [compost metagenome]